MRRGVRSAVSVRALAALLGAIVLLALSGSSASAKTTWLCRPGQAPDPCTPGLATTVYSPTGQVLRVIHPKAVAHPKIDCFYVYPTVSEQPTTLANLHVDPSERSIALYQTARYSQLCRVFAPMYRQVTLAGIAVPGGTSPAAEATPLSDVRRAFADYLKHDNHGRGFVLIGHSQGSFVLRSLIATDIDPKAAVRRRLLSAILLGGNVTVAAGRGIGGDFKHIPACRSKSQLGCVIAWSTFDTPVLSNTLFGAAPGPGLAVLCTNPATLAGTGGLVDVITPSQPFAPGTTLAAGITLLGLTQPMPPTPWVEEPGAYSAACSSSNNANVLQITPRNGAQTPNPTPDGRWGLHLIDGNIALGNLLTVVRAESAAFARRP